MLCVANLSRSAQPVELDLSAYKGRVPVEMLGRTTFPPIGDLPYLLTLSAHGFYWFKLTTDAEAPPWHEQVLSIDERPVLVLFDGWSSLFRDRVVPWRIGMAEKTRLQFETDTLPRFIETQRWYAAKGTPHRTGAHGRPCAVAGGEDELGSRAAAGGRSGARSRTTSCRSRSPGRIATRIACVICRRRRWPRCVSKPASA